jgi:hypothetical protein
MGHIVVECLDKPNQPPHFNSRRGQFNYTVYVTVMQNLDVKLSEILHDLSYFQPSLVHG